MLLPRAATGAVLVGGESLRFGSDKAVALFRCEPLLAHVLRGLLAQFDEVLLIAKEPERYAEYARGHVRLVADLRSARTPLAGLEAALSAATHELVFACAGDMPLAPDAALLDALVSAIEGHDAAVPVHDGMAQPLCALWRRPVCLPRATALLAVDGQGPRALLERLHTARVPWADARPFLDVDTQQALEELELLCAGSAPTTS